MEIKCHQCNATIQANFILCPHCGVENKEFQQTKTIRVEKEHHEQVSGSSTLLYILCVFTIIGSVFGFFRGFIYQVIGSGLGDAGYIRGILFMLTNAGTLVGAILMISKKLTGFNVYNVSQIAYIILVLFTMTIYEYTDGFSLIVGSFFLIPSIIFLFLYQMQDVKKHLK